MREENSPEKLAPCFRVAGYRSGRAGIGSASASDLVHRDRPAFTRTPFRRRTIQHRAIAVLRAHLNGAFAANRAKEGKVLIKATP